MKKVALILILVGLYNPLFAQNSKFFVQIQVSPKITINNNTGILASGLSGGGSNEQDGRSALAFGLRDYSVAAGYRLSKKSSLSLGLGMYAVHQIFRPSYSNFGGDYRNIHKYRNFFTIPISFEHQLYAHKKLNFYAGLHLTFIGDVFAHKNNRELQGNLVHRDGTVNENIQWHYSNHHVNSQTFNFLYGFSVKGEYKLTENISFCVSAQMMQGFRPLITSLVTITEGNNIYNPSISTTNGQSIMMNLGVRYNF